MLLSAKSVAVNAAPAQPCRVLCVSRCINDLTVCSISASLPMSSILNSIKHLLELKAEIHAPGMPHVVTVRHKL